LAACWRAALQPIFEGAVRALSAGDYGAAEQGFLAVLKASPQNIGALGNLGVVYSRTNRPGKAIAVYHRALKISPNDSLLQLNLGLAYLKQDDHARALPLFAQVIAAEPGHKQARELLATCRLYTGDVATAIRELEALRADEPHNSGVLYLLGVGYAKNKQPDKAKAALDEMFSTAVAPAQAQFLLGKTYYDAGQFPEAEQFFLKALELDPQIPNVKLELAKVCLSQRRTEDATTQLRQILSTHPRDADANYFLGGALVQDGRFQEAIPFLENARQLTPESWAVYFYLGKAMFQLNRFAEAAPLLKQAAELNPQEAAIYYQLGKALQKLGRDREAQTALRRVRELRTQALNREVDWVSHGVAGVR
jgi:tetratricopeptide (TPR) repeat protein